MLTEAQKEVKLAYLEQENNRLRSALINYQIISGEITWDGKNQKGEDQQREAQEGEG